MQASDWRQWCTDLASPKSGLGFQLCQRTRCRPDWHIPWRRLDHHLLYLLQRGHVDARCGSERVLVQPWSALWVGPGVAHRFLPDGSGEAPVLYHCRFTVHSSARTDAWQCIPGVQDHEWTMAQLLDSFQHAPRLRSERLRLLTSLLFTGLADRALHPGSGGLDREQRLLIDTWLERHIAHDPQPADLAAALGLSPSWFARLFKRSYGMPPRAWLKQQRIRRAAVMLEEGEEAIGHIASALGYSDIFNFSKQFKAVLGRSPSAYRRQVRGT